MPDGAGAQIAVFHQPPAGQRQGHKAPGDGGRPGPAVPLEHVAVNGDGPLSQLSHIHGGAEGPAHQALNLGAPGGELQFGHVPLAPLPVGPGEHGVLGGDPALSVGDMRRHPVFHAGAAEDHGVPALDEAAALSEFHEVRGHGHRPQFIERPAVFSGQVDSSS